MKTNILKNLKQGTFLIIAILATFISYSQSTITIGGTKIPTDPNGLIHIGGNKPPVGEFISNNLVANKLCDTGGGQTTIKPPILFFKNTVCEFVSPDDIGGNGGVIIGRPGIGGKQQEPTNPFSSLIVSQSEPMSLFDIGGKDKPEPILIMAEYESEGLLSVDTGDHNSGGEYAMFDDGKTIGEYNLVYFPEHGCSFDTGRGKGTETSTGGDDGNYDIGGGRNSNGSPEFVTD